MGKNADKIDNNKKALLKALETSLGVVTTACRNVGLSRETFYKYVRNDPKFAEKVTDLQNVALDFVESSLFKQIREGVPSSTIFYLKTKGKKRGYSERLEVDAKVNHSGSIVSRVQGMTDAELVSFIEKTQGVEPWAETDE